MEMSPMFSIEQKLKDIGRLNLANLPTPIHFQEKLSQKLGVELYVKRDDLSGVVLSGNKIRKLEYLLFDAQQKQADVVLTCGGVQSNHCRATVFAARQLGIDAEVFLRGLDGQPSSGNLLLCRLADAKTHSLTQETYMQRDELMLTRAEALQKEGRTPYLIPEGGSNALGSLGYIGSMLEIHQEVADADFIITAVGSGGTLAGLLAGAELADSKAKVIGVPVCDDGEIFCARVNDILNTLKTLIPEVTTQARREHFCDGHVGLGYAQATNDELGQIRSVVKESGLVLDPVYTNKAFSGMLQMIADQRIPANSKVLFLHTGGIFGLAPFADRLS